MKMLIFFPRIKSEDDEWMLRILIWSWDIHESHTGMCRSHDSRHPFIRPVGAAVMTPFFQASQCSLAYQFPINALLMCPPFSIPWKFCIFSLVFGQNFSSQDAKFLSFCSQDPLFFKEVNLPRPYFWNPTFGTHAAHTHQKKVECPPGHTQLACYAHYAPAPF